MSRGGPAQITALLGELRQGNKAARDQLVTLVYPELRRIAAHYLKQERPDHTLRTTALVHEVYVRLFGSEHVDWQSRAHLFAAVARDMRHILVDYARARNAKKRLRWTRPISLSDIEPAAGERGEDLVALDEALSRLEADRPASQPGGGAAVLHRLERARNGRGARHLDLDLETRLELRENLAVRSTGPGPMQG